jgi:hypothetical protein
MDFGGTVIRLMGWLTAREGIVRGSIEEGITLFRLEYESWMGSVTTRHLSLVQPFTDISE